MSLLLDLLSRASRETSVCILTHGYTLIYKYPPGQRDNELLCSKPPGLYGHPRKLSPCPLQHVTFLLLYPQCSVHTQNSLPSFVVVIGLDLRVFWGLFPTQNRLSSYTCPLDSLLGWCPQAGLGPGSTLTLSQTHSDHDATSSLT